VQSASLLVLAAAVSGCTYDIPNLAASGAAHDASTAGDGATMLDAAGTHPGSDAMPTGDAATGSTVYSDIGDPSKWEVFDTSLATGTAESFAGGTFDGRYVYFAPSVGASWYSVVPRFDTTNGAGFKSAAAWSTFDTQAVSASAQGFVGALYDGAGSLYLTPFAVSSGAPDGFVASYTTQAPFTSTGSWAAFDTSTVNPNSQGFSGEAFDGRYLYLVPSVKGVNSSPNGFVARCDTQASAPCSTGGAWAFFDLTLLSPDAIGFLGAVFDGRYVDFIPSYDSTAVRYDTTADFANLDSWSVFDTGNVAQQPPGFEGGAFDGRYVYYVPSVYETGMGDTFLSVVVRFDTTGNFTSAGSWSSFDLHDFNSSAKGFTGGAFDGRYVYFIPWAIDATSPDDFVFDGVVVRYDTTASFASGGSWSSFDTSTLNGSPQGYYGAVFDGEYLYLIPSANSLAVRFDAKTPRSMPALPQFQGSFL
jgi:hypothetical protein